MTRNPIAAQIEAARKDLLDLTLRNPLLNYRLLRARGVEGTGICPTLVFDMLVRQGRSLSFVPGATQQGKLPSFMPDADEDTRYFWPECPRCPRWSFLPGTAEANVDVSKPSGRVDTRVKTTESEEQLSKRLLNTYYTSRTLIEEQGINTLFVALGMVHWYEDDSSDLLRRAPLILIPVEIERANVADRFHIRYDQEDVGANISFIEKAKHDFGVDIPRLHKADEEDDADIDVAGYLDSVAVSVQPMARWSVDPSSVVLGFFSFQKLLMYHDLDEGIWPSGRGPQGNSVMTSLFRDGFSDPGPAIGPGDRLDDHLDPSDMHHVLDADSSQAVVIADVSKGRNLVVQGPPGTGKSQTIVNILADAISEGKTALFVSEKMAALEVVKRRMDGLELGDVCLELHSRKTTKRAVLDELRRTIELGRPHTQGIPEALKSLTRSRDRLNSYDLAVNTPVARTGTTPHTAMGELSRLAAGGQAAPLPAVDIRGIGSWSKAQFERRRETVNELRVVLDRTGVPGQHLFWGVGLDVLTPQEQQGLQQAIEISIGSLRRLASRSSSLGELMQVVLPDHPSGVEVVLRYLELRATYDHVLRPEAWGAELGGARQALVEKGRKFFRFLSGEFRHAKRQVASVWRSSCPRTSGGGWRLSIRS